MIRKKLRSKRGLTLTELLAAMAILALLGVALTAGISAAAKAYSDITMNSHASILSGTLAVDLADELRFAENIEDDGSGNITFTSMRFGEKVKFENDTASGHIVVENGSTKYEILADKAYMKLAAETDISYSGGLFTVEITIKSPGGTTLREITLSVSSISA